MVKFKLELVKLNGYSMFVDSDDTNIAPVLLKDHIWEPKSTELVKQNVKRGDTFVDCGAHWGYYSLMVGKIGAYAFAFEPNPRSFMVLSINSHFQEPIRGHILIYNMAVWSKNSPLCLRPELGTTGGSRIVAEVIADPKIYVKKGILVSGVSLDDFLGKSTVDFIKVDCEGTDIFALQGAKRILTEQSPKVMAEHPSPRFMQSLGYRMTHEFKDEQTSFWEKVKT